MRKVHLPNYLVAVADTAAAAFVAVQRGLVSLIKPTGSRPCGIFERRSALSAIW